MARKEPRYNFEGGSTRYILLLLIALLLWAATFFDTPRLLVFFALAKTLETAKISAIPNAIRNVLPEKLAAEREELKARVAALESRLREAETLGSNSENLMGPGIPAIIESVPPQSPYDIILIQARLDDHITRGQKVVKNGILLGEVEEVSINHAKVKLLSYPKLQTEAFLESRALNITLEGYGGLNMIFQAPKDLEIKMGEKVLSNTSPPYLIGEVGYIKLKESDPLQTVYIRPPLNLRHLRSVEVVP